MLKSPSRDPTGLAGVTASQVQCPPHTRLGGAFTAREAGVRLSPVKRQLHLWPGCTCHATKPRNFIPQKACLRWASLRVSGSQPCAQWFLENHYLFQRAFDDKMGAVTNRDLGFISFLHSTDSVFLLPFISFATLSL